MIKTKSSRRVLSWVLCFVLIFTLLPVPVVAAAETSTPDCTWYGDGSAIAYAISTADELAGLAVLVNGGKNFYGKIITLADNIDLSGYNDWTPIGDTGGNSFNGVFDGDGHLINGLTVNAESEYVGLFGLIDYNAAVENLTVSGNVTGKTESSRIGGISGENRGQVQYCGFSGSVTDASIYGTAVGGLFGYNLGPVINCFNAASVANGIYAGGIIGINDGGGLQNSYNTGSVSGRSGAYVGGLAGYNRATVMLSYNTGSVTGGSYLGGACGMNDGGSVWYVYWNTDEMSGEGFGDSTNSAYSYEVNDMSVAEMQDEYFVETLTDYASLYKLSAWKKDTANINGGYPVIDMDDFALLPRIQTRILPEAMAQTAYYCTLTASQPVTWSIEGDLPDGLSIDTNTGVISGTPIYEFTTAWFTVKAENSSGSATRDFSIWVAPFYEPPAPPAIQTTSLPSAWIGDYYLQYLSATGDWPTWSIIEGALPNGLDFYGSGTIEGYPTKGGTFNFTVQADNYTGSDTKTLSITVKIPDGHPPVIPTNALPDGTVGVPYSHTLEVQSATPVTWSIVPNTGALPGGLSLDPATGVISGTPTPTGREADWNHFTLRAENAGDKTEMGYNLCIYTPASVAPTITTSSNLTYNVGVPFYLQCEASGSAPISWNITGELPLGCAVASAGGTVMGTPVMRGSYTFTVTATNDMGSDSKEITIKTVGGRDEDYGLIFDPADGKFYLAYGDNSEVYTGQADKWAWDAQTKTLSLNGFAWDTPANNALVILNEDYITFTIHLTGTNTFKSNFTGIAATSYLGTLNFTGDGSLHITAGGANAQFGTGIESGGPITVNGGNITIDAAGYQIVYGILTNGDLVITGGKVDVSASGGTSGEDCGAIGVVCFYCGLVVIDGGELNTSGDKYGIYGVYADADGEFTVVFTDGKLTAAGGEKAFEGSYGAAAYVPAANYVYWANTAASDPGGAGTSYPGTAYTHNDGYKFIKLNSLFTPLKNTYYTISPLNADGWTNADFIITAKTGYTLSTVNTAAGPWSSVLTYGTETDGGSAVFYVKDTATGEISAAAAEAYKIDKTAPSAAVQYKTHTFKSFLNTTTYSLFFKNSAAVTLQGADARSGVSQVAFYKAGSAVADPATGISGWTTGTSCTVTQNEKCILYVRVTDKAGNQAFFYEGVAAYTDSAAITESISFTKTSSGDVTADVTLNGNTIDKINNGTQDLTQNTHYTVSSGTITFKAAYLDTLAAGSHILTVYYKPLGETYVSGTLNEAPATTTLSLTISKADQPAPSVPAEASKTAASITLTAIAGAEYSLDGATWQGSEAFTGLSANTGYTFYARLKETANYNASPASSISAVITTEKETLTGTVNITINPVTGEVTASATGGNTGTAGTPTYTWSGGAAGTGASATPTTGSAATCTVTASGTTGSISSQVTVYRVDITYSDNETGDSAVIAAPYGKSGDTVSIAYSVGTTGNTTNRVAFTGGTVSDSGTSPAAYEITATDAVGGVITITAAFTHESLPVIDGTLNALLVDAATGKLTAIVSGGSGAYRYAWSVAGQGTTTGTVSGSEYTPDASELGREITCTITKTGTFGSLEAKATVYKAAVTKSGGYSGTDSITIANPYGKAGDSVSIAYTLGNTGLYRNTLTYSNVTNPPAPVTTPGSAASVYTLLAADAAANGVITITAVFAHLDAPDTLITAAAITGVTAPATGSAPSAVINNGTGFTASLSWNGSPSVFAYNTVYTTTVTLSAAVGYTFDGGFNSTASISGFAVNGIAPVFVSNNGSTLVFTVTFPATGPTPDMTYPEGTITVKTRGFTSFLNAITFGLFFKDTQTVTITADDISGSAVTIAYALANTEIASGDLSSASWQPYGGSFNISPGKHIIYAKLTNTSGNYNIINTEGIVLYADSAQSTASIQFTKGNTADVTANVTLNGNTIQKIMNGVDTLTSGTHYTVSGGIITFKAGYVNSLTAGSYTLTIYYSPQGVPYPVSPSTGSEAPAATTITLTVNAAQTYTVVVSSAGTGATGGGSYAAGAVVNIGAGTAPGGKQFKKWTASPAVTFANENSSSTSFTMPAYAVTVTAVFEDIPTTVTGVTVSPGNIQVQRGMTQQFSATVTGTNNPPQNVIWSILNGFAGTTITSGGALYIAENEPAATLTVRATSTLAGFTDRYGEATVTVTEALPPPVYGISLDKSGTYVFPNTTAGSGTQNSVTVTVSNAGNQPTGALTVMLGGNNPNSFILSSRYINSIAPGGFSTFTVSPDPTLGAGTYTATVMVSGDGNIVSKSFDISVTVSAVPACTAAVFPTGWTYAAATAGYGTQSAQEFIITNIGTKQISGLSASLSGSSFEINAALSDTSVSAGEAVTVSVRPRTGLSADIYADTLTITGSDGIHITVSLSFTVNPAAQTADGETGTGAHRSVRHETNPDRGNGTDERSPDDQTATPEPAPEPAEPDSTPPVSNTIIDGIAIEAGEVKTNGDTTTVVIHQTAFNKQLENATTNVTVTIPADTGTAAAELVVKNVDDMADKAMTLTIQVGNVQYEIPAAAIDTLSILAAIGAENAADVPISITIATDMSAAAQAAVNAAVAATGGELVIPPLSFTITATFNGQTVEIDTFSQYVSRSVEITAVQAAQITTAVVVDPDGTTRHMPTRVYEKDGVWYAEVNNLTNSTYAFVNSEKIFADAKGNWYENAVNEMASRMIVSGIGGDLFAGDRDITRAEFAAIMIRALGLPANGNGTVFVDIPRSAWYCGAVGKAYEYGLVSGIGGGRFAPDKKITRQEAMLMIRRAANIAKFVGSTGNLDAFTDAEKVSDWALEAAMWNVGSGLAAGSDGQLRPQDHITRAETAALVLKLLQKAGLVDVRTPLAGQGAKTTPLAASPPRKEPEPAVTPDDDGSNSDNADHPDNDLLSHPLP